MSPVIKRFLPGTSTLTGRKEWQGKAYLSLKNGDRAPTNPLVIHACRKPAKELRTNPPMCACPSLTPFLHLCYFPPSLAQFSDTSMSHGGTGFINKEAHQPEPALQAFVRMRLG
jgi:hypothetical protein